MNLHRLTIAFVLVACMAAAAREKSSPLPAAELMNQVVANELTDRAQQRKWMYLIDKREGKQTLTAELVDTRDGPLYRLLDKHVEHTVKIVGVVSNATAHGMKEDTKEEMKEHGMDKNSTERSHMTATDLIMVSATCQK